MRLGVGGGLGCGGVEVCEGFGGALNAYSPHHGTRITNTWGVTVSAHEDNALGSYVRVDGGSPLAKAAMGVRLMVSQGSASAAIRNNMLTLATDPLGGTSYTNILIPNLMLGAGTNAQGPYFEAFFPLSIPAGHSVAVAAQCTHTAAQNIYVYPEFFHDLDGALKLGSAVEAVGAAAASSAGTAVTPGTSSEGAWTELGSLTNAAFHFQLGVGCADDTIAGVLYTADLAASLPGDDTTKLILMENVVVQTNAVEAFGARNHNLPRNYRKLPAGAKLWGRLQSAGAADDGLTMAAYATYAA